ncbi:patatin-like phospholipase family protein [Anditalea andensis]|uniref:Phospholipase n=1 Tax=Anditalea andensis TaxID=1048983 RepID=A0A074KZ77_9BACT|nr:patatin-like phospholipase family protein [Anditalea andensis]KEO73515.1 phospholipase [Anditalea andensis]
MATKTVSLVLSSGGARGLAHIGVIEALEANGYQINAIAGCSMGALIAGVYAKGNLKEFTHWICHLDRIDVFSLMDFTLSSRGFIKGEKVFNVIQTLIGDIQIEELPVPFLCNAVDISNGEERIFDNGSLFSAIRASASIPTVIQPAQIDGRQYVDGGLVNPLPLSLLKPFQSDLVVASDVNGPIDCLVPQRNSEKEESSILAVPAWVVEYKQKISKYLPRDKKEAIKLKSVGFFDLMTFTLDVMQDKISDYIVAQHPVDLHIKISRRQCGTFEFYRAKEIIDIGRQLTLDALKEKKLMQP